MSDQETAPTTAPDGASAPPPIFDPTSLYEQPSKEEEPAKEPGAEEEAAPAEQVNAQETPPDSETGEEEGETISSLPDLVKHQEWDQEWFDSLKVPVKVDGEPAEATIRDLIKSYQIGSAAEKRLEEAKQARAKTQAELAEKAQALESQYSVAAELIKGAESFLEQDVKSIDWGKLREDDPAEYSAKKAEVAERRAQIDEMKRNAVASYQKLSETNQQELQEKLLEKRQAEEAALLEKLPDWQDQDKAKEEKSALAKYLLSEGFSKQDVLNTLDHRLVLMARKAMLYDQGQANASAAKKKVAKVSKVLKPGTKADNSKPKPRDAAEILYGAS